MRASHAVLILSLVGCKPRWDEDSVEGVRRSVVELKSNSLGYIEIDYEVLDGDTSVLINAEPEAPYQAHVFEVTTPDGDTYYDSDTEWRSPFSRTNGGYASAVPTFVWPMHESKPLQPGVWTLVYGTVDDNLNYTPKVPTRLTAFAKRDANLEKATVKATIFYVDGLADNDEVVQGTEAAVEHWQSVYDGLGIALGVTYARYDARDLNLPGFGSASAYEGMSGDVALREVVLVVGEEIATFDDIYGISGDIPGPMIPSEKSAILMSASVAAGTDGVFSATEIRLYGETMAHETAHYFGLFHPVEATWDAWDALDDTPDCQTRQSCVRQMDRHLMFPFPLCGFNGCTPQSEMTEQQLRLVHRNVHLR